MLTPRHTSEARSLAANDCRASIPNNASTLSSHRNAVHNASIHDTVNTFLRLLYDQQHGWCEVAWIDGDPDANAPLKRTWRRYGGEHTPMLLQDMMRLCAGQFNVYVSACLYTEPHRSAAVLPTRAIVVDDLPSAQPCSFFIQTSHQRRQGYFLLNEPVSSDVRGDLARRAAYALGGDTGGWDNQQLIRVPGGWNTKAKYGEPFLCMLRIGNRERSTAMQLRQRWPEVAATSGTASQLDWQQVEYELGRVDVLLHRLKPESYVAKILRGDVPITNRSDMRCTAAKGAAMHGLPDAEIAALLIAFCDWGHSTEKGTKWLYEDINRIICIPDPVKGTHVPDIRAQHGTVPAPTRGSSRRAGALPAIEPPRKGRTSKLTPDALFAFYAAQRSSSDVVLLTLNEVAARLQVSISTVRRCEKVLVAAGKIQRRLFNRKQSSLVELLVCENTSVQKGQQPSTEIRTHVCSDHDEDRSTMRHSDVFQHHEETHPHAQPILPYEATQPVAPMAGAPMGVCSIPEARLTPRVAPTIRDMVAEGLVAGQQFVDRVSKKTGEIKRVRRAPTYTEILAFVRSQQPDVTEAAVRYWWDQRTNLIWHGERIHVQRLSDADLLKTIIARQRTLMRHIGEPREGYHRARLAIADDERQRRQLSMPEPGQAAQQASMMRSPDAPHPPADVAPVAAPAPEQRTLDMAPQCPVYDAKGLIARLYARKQAQASSSYQGTINHHIKEGAYGEA